MELYGECVCPRGLCCFWAQSMMRAVPVQGQDPENSAVLVTQGSLVHQSSPTFRGMLGPVSSLLALSFFLFSKAAVSVSPTCESVATYTQILSGCPLLQTPLLTGLPDPCPVTHTEDAKTEWRIPFLNAHATGKKKKINITDLHCPLPPLPWTHIPSIQDCMCVCCAFMMVECLCPHTLERTKNKRGTRAPSR